MALVGGKIQIRTIYHLPIFKLFSNSILFQSILENKKSILFLKEFKNAFFIAV